MLVERNNIGINKAKIISQMRNDLFIKAVLINMAIKTAENSVFRNLAESNKGILPS